MMKQKHINAMASLLYAKLGNPGIQMLCMVLEDSAESLARRLEFLTRKENELIEAARRAEAHEQEGV